MPRHRRRRPPRRTLIEQAHRDGSSILLGVTGASVMVFVAVCVFLAVTEGRC